MAISLKDFHKTKYSGLYISNKEFENRGYKYICRFQIEHKKYVKVIGYTNSDNLDDKLALEKMNSYKAIVMKNITTRKVTDTETKTSQSLDCMIEFLKDYDDCDFLQKSIIKAYQYKELESYQKELIKLQHHLEKSGKKIIILFEGRDASGKGGAIRRLTRYMNNKHYRIVALGKPTPTQKTQWYFQRYIEHFPSGGEIVLYDRSWYNRAMVEPVFGFCSKSEYNIFMEDVTGFERDLTRQGIILLKLYFSVSKEEQALRFERRKNDPLRQWKLSEVDLQAQGYWDEFTKKKYKMLKNTHSIDAPWIVLRSNNKFKARLEAIKHILNSVEYLGKDLSLDYKPNTKISVSVEEELSLMRAEGTV